MYLSYSGWKLFEQCPRAYMFRYVTKPFLLRPDNRVNAMYGTVVGKVFEIFFAKTLWKRPGYEEALRALADKLLDKEIEDAIAGARNAAETSKADPEVWAAQAVMWKGQGQGQDPKANYASKEDLREDIQDSIPRGIEIIRSHGLTGATAHAELQLDAKFGDHTLVGRADFVIAHEKNKRDILDGKGSRWGDKYLDETQLIWYSMLWRERTGHLPDRIGFILWRKEPEKAMTWVSLPVAEVDGLRAEVMETIEEVETSRVRFSLATPDRHEALANERFAPRPGPLHCKLCQYLQICDTGKAWEATEKLEMPSTVSVVPTDETGVEDASL